MSTFTLKNDILANLPSTVTVHNCNTKSKLPRLYYYDKFFCQLNLEWCIIFATRLFNNKQANGAISIKQNLNLVQPMLHKNQFTNSSQ